MWRGRPIDLETIFEEIDYRQRFVPDFDVLAAALRRVGVEGVLLESAPGTYVARRTGVDSGVVLDLWPETYESSLRAYHHGFTETLVKLNSGRLMRGTTGLFEAVHRLTGGRFGLEPGMVDLDGVSLAFVLNEALQPLGWACESAHRVDRVRMVEVVPRGPGESADRDEVRSAMDRVVREGRRFTGLHRLVFPDGIEVEIAAS